MTTKASVSTKNDAEWTDTSHATNLLLRNKMQ